MKTKKSISKSFLIILIVIAYLPVVILGSIALQRQYSAFHKESKKQYIDLSDLCGELEPGKVK